MKFAKQILLTLAIIVTTAALAACGADDIGDAGSLSALFTREQFLIDFDLFVGILEDDFPHLGVAYRRFGVDFLQIAAELRPIIADDGFPINLYIFRQLLLNNFFMHPDISHPIADWYIGAPQRRPSETQLRDSLPHVQTNIIEPGRIGHIRINCFDLFGIGTILAATTIANDFFAETADFEHIIVDIRGAGGRVDMWNRVLLYPFVTQEVYMTHLGHTLQFVFAQNRERLRATLDALGMTGFDEIYAIADMELPPHLNPADLEGLEYGFEMMNFRLIPSREATPSGNFGGQLWLLIDGETSSGAAVLAETIKHADIAILVGEPVGGNTACLTPWADAMHIQYRLPFTRTIIGFNVMYVTNHLGQNVDEYVTRPHFYNMQGMDALETVLALIAAAAD